MDTLYTAPSRGKVIVVEGGEGAGKTTVVRRVVEAMGDKILSVREPGGTTLGTQVRGILLDSAETMAPLTEFLLFWASRSQLIAEVTRPALARGVHVLYDRFSASTFAYQIRGRQLDDLELFNALERGVCDMMRPDCYIFLDMDPELGMRRASKRGALDRIEREGPDYHERVRQGYLEFFVSRPHVVVDARQSEDEVFAEVLGIITRVCSQDEPVPEEKCHS